MMQQLVSVRRKKKSRSEKQSTSSRASRVLELPMIQRQLAGMGHVLEQSKQRKRVLSQYESQMEGRVLHLLREQKKTRQSIEEKHRQLQHILEVRRRQQQQREEKQRLLEEKARELDEARNRSLINRVRHQANKNQSLQRLQNQRRQMYLQTKDEQSQAEDYKIISHNQELLKRRSTKLLIDEGIAKGKERIEQFHREQASRHLRQYRSRIQHENIQSRNRLSRASQLQKQEQQLLSFIERQQIMEDQLMNKIGQAVNMDLEELEKDVVMKKASRMASRKSRRSTLSSSSSKREKMYSLESKFEIYSERKKVDSRQSRSRMSRQSTKKQLI